jgi:16S rRNA (guanine527-N7)-methyltransferase
VDLLARLEEGCARLGLAVPRERLAGMLAHLEYVLAENRRVNLTAITDPAAAVELHLLDSLTGLPHLPVPGPTPLHVVDVGTGAGFPGVPLALARPESLRVLLLDAQRRRITVLAGILRRLGVTNAQAVHGRAEELGRGPRRETFDAAVARAVGSLAEVAEYGLPLVRPGGRLVAYRGERGEEEAAAAAEALAELGGEVVGLHRLRLPFSGAQRVLVVVEKRRPCPARYPRRPGMAAKRPLA